LLSKGPKVTVIYKHFYFKGPPTSLISSALYFNLGVEAFLGGLSGDRAEFWVPVAGWALPNWGAWSADDTALVKVLLTFGAPSMFYLFFLFASVNRRKTTTTKSRFKKVKHILNCTAT